MRDPLNGYNQQPALTPEQRKTLDEIGAGIAADRRAGAYRTHTLPPNCGDGRPAAQQQQVRRAAGPPPDLTIIRQAEAAVRALPLTGGYPGGVQVANLGPSEIERDDE